MKGAVITGATGMLGRALTERLVREGLEVLLLVNPASVRRSGLLSESPLVSVIACGLDDYASFAIQNDGRWDVFYHFAWKGTFGDARNDVRLQEENIRFTLDAVDLAARLGCSRFVGAGSQAEYGRVEGALSSDTPTNPENGYGMAKLAAGRMSRLHCKKRGLQHVWTRILSVYGPEDGKQTMIMSTLGALLEGRAPSLTSCEQYWDYLYRDDAAEALYLVGQKGEDGSVYPVGSGVARPLREYVDVMRNAVNPGAEIGFGRVPYADGQVMHLEANIEELQVDTGFVPRVDFEEGIGRTLEWLKRRQ